MKILHILSQKPAFTGSGTYFNALIAECKKSGHPSHLIFGSSSQEEIGEFETFDFEYSTIIFNTDELPFPLPGMSDVMPYKSSVFKEMSEDELMMYKEALKKVIAKAIMSFKPDVIWVHHLWIAASIVSEYSSKLPVIGFCHGSDLLQCKKNPNIYKFIKERIERLSFIVSTSPQQISEIHCIFPSAKVKYLGNAIRDDIFYLRKNNSIKKEIIKVAYAGKLSKEKGVHSLIAAADDLLHLGYRFELNLFGSGDSAEADYIRSLPSNHNSIIFRGVISQAELAVQLNDTAIFVLPSFYEGLGLVAIEALACGCRIIISDIPNLIKILPPKLIEMNSVLIIPSPGLSNSIELSDLENFTSLLKSALKKQFMSNEHSREDIADSVQEFKFSSLFAKIVDESRCYL